MEGTSVFGGPASSGVGSLLCDPVEHVTEISNHATSLVRATARHLSIPYCHTPTRHIRNILLSPPMVRVGRTRPHMLSASVMKKRPSLSCRIEPSFLRKVRVRLRLRVARTTPLLHLLPTISLPIRRGRLSTMPPFPLIGQCDYRTQFFSRDRLCRYWLPGRDRLTALGCRVRFRFWGCRDRLYVVLFR